MPSEDVAPLSECERCGGANDHPFNPLCRSCERAEADKDKLWLSGTRKGAYSDRA